MVNRLKEMAFLQHAPMPHGKPGKVVQMFLRNEEDAKVIQSLRASDFSQDVDTLTRLKRNVG